MLRGSLSQGDKIRSELRFYKHLWWQHKHQKQLCSAAGRTWPQKGNRERLFNGGKYMGGTQKKNHKSISFLQESGDETGRERSSEFPLKWFNLWGSHTVRKKQQRNVITTHDFPAHQHIGSGNILSVNIKIRSLYGNNLSVITEKVLQCYWKWKCSEENTWHTSFNLHPHTGNNWRILGQKSH